MRVLIMAKEGNQTEAALDSTETHTIRVTATDPLKG